MRTVKATVEGAMDGENLWFRVSRKRLRITLRGCRPIGSENGPAGSL